MRSRFLVERVLKRIFQMRIYLQFLIISMCFCAECLAQSPVPVSTYTLHAQKEPREWSLGEIPTPPSTVLATTPAGALLILIPQPERKWILKELKGWSTQTPREQSLAVGSDAPRDGDVWITGDLIVTRDGRYALVRITSRRRSSKPARFEVQASVTLVDLQAFSIVYRRTTTEPLIAGAQWSLTKDNLLISNALTERSRVNKQSTSTVTDNYEAAVLKLPDLETFESCSYTMVLELHDGSGWRTKEEKTEELKCANVLQAAKVASVSGLPGENIAVKTAKELRAPAKCSITDLSDDGRFALYDCFEGHEAWDTFITTSHSLLVLSTADSTAILSITLKVKQPTIATLATAEGQQYLILVRDGIKVEAYRVR